MFLFFPSLQCLYCPLTYICCSFHGHSMCVLRHYSNVFVPCRGACSLFSYPLLFSRMRSEGFPFIVWGSGGWTLVRLQLLVGSPSRRRRVVVASLIPSLWGKLQNLSFSNVIHAACLAVLRRRRGTLWHSNLFANVSKVSKLKDVSHETLVLVRPRVSSRVSGFPLASPCLWGEAAKPSVSSRVSAFPLASPCLWGKLQSLACFAALTSPCLWGKLQNLSLCFCSSGVAVSMGEAAKPRLVLLRSGVAVSMGKAAKPRLFCCAHVAVSMGEAAKPQSRLEFLLVLWRRCVCGGSCKTSLVLLRSCRLEFMLILWRRRGYGESCQASLVLLRSRRRVFGGSCKTSVSSRVSACPLASPCL